MYIQAITQYGLQLATINGTMIATTVEAFSKIYYFVYLRGSQRCFPNTPGFNNITCTSTNLFDCSTYKYYYDLTKDQGYLNY